MRPSARSRLALMRISEKFHKRDFWLEENLNYADPYFRLEKCARIVNSLAQSRDCDLLDVGCGPATLASLLHKNIAYFGLDIAIHNPAPNLHELDFAQNEIEFDGRSFDIIVAAGVFEYLGLHQNKKFSEIRNVMKRDGKFVLTYTNFNHLNDKLIDHSIYNNIKTIDAFKRELEAYFRIEKWFPSSHNWYCSEPRRKFLKQVQMPLEIFIPIISPMLAINYFFICSLKDEG
jgi:cyclopropane fatty-acyl-phospholipid synthase-like methyltransferase